MDSVAAEGRLSGGVWRAWAGEAGKKEEARIVMGADPDPASRARETRPGCGAAGGAAHRADQDAGVTPSPHRRGVLPVLHWVSD